ncbi:hypothetical protein OIV83_005472 [Microbotryomycetes sp. JL201]|nr:hypothetical protein OIV83_005472 [Microbotryomycetes sp. JL201]
MADSEHGSASQDASAAHSSNKARTFMAYSRMTLLSLHKSPLVPTRPDGMKELSEWYGEYTGQPASPPTKPRDLHHQGRNAHGAHGQANSPPSHSASRSNPFTNFGRFGVDGGLEGTGAIGSAGKFASLAGLGSGNGPEKRRDAPGEISLAGTGRQGRYTESGKPGSSYFTNERDRSERMKGKQDGASGGSKRDENAVGKRGDRRTKAEDGGWRSVPATGDRRGQRTDVGAARDARRDERGGSARSGRPAWMDDEGPRRSAEPAWLDEPAAGMMTFEAGRGIDLPAATDGMDSIQAWKKQMKEMEGKANPLQNVESQPKASVFATLINKADPSTKTTDGADKPVTPEETRAPMTEAKSAEGGRGSRFARFFDGKPATQAAPSPQSLHTDKVAPNFFDAMLAKSSKSPAPTGSPGPSKEDAESMSRLLGMLQMSGARAASPSDSRASPMTSPPPQPVAAPLSDERKGSRFGFSQSPSHVDLSNKPPTSVQSFSDSLQSFGLPALGMDARGHNKHVEHSQSNHSRSSSTQLHHVSHVSHGAGSGSGFPVSLSHTGQQPAPMTSLPPVPNASHAPLLSPMSAASHPLPPPGMPPSRDGMPPHSLPGSVGHPLPPVAPSNRPSGMPPLSGPPPLGDLPAHLRHLLPSPPPSGFPPGQQPVLHTIHQDGNRQPPSMMPGGMHPPHFMMYPPPPPSSFSGQLPPNFRNVPPMQPPNMANVPFNAQGLPDLMALLNSGGGGAASSRLPPASPQQPRQ